MAFRFLSVLVLVVCIGLAGNLWERRCLDLHRDISRQHYRIDVLTEQEVRIRLLAESFSTPERLREKLDAKLMEGEPSRRVGAAPRIGSTPLLRWTPKISQERK